MGRRRGFTLIEVILAVALVGAGLLVLVSLLPSGVLSLKKAEDLQTATAYGVEVMEASRRGLAQTPHLADFTVTMNATEFHVTRLSQAVAGGGGRLYDVCVNVSWHGQPGVQFATRMASPP